MKTIRWGILGTGMIAKKFADGLSVLEDAELIAVGSRTVTTAVAFAEAFGIPQPHGSYEALAQNPEVDVIYVATPHVFHMENSLTCLENGKAILCEKPFTINKNQAQTVFSTAQKNNLFVMEAMWSYFLPAMEMVRKLIHDGIIGDVRMISADFGFRTTLDPESRLFDPALGGGALLDVGIYPLALAQMIFGAPSHIASLAHIGTTAVDEQAGIILGYDNGELAVLHTAVQTETPQEAIIMGTEGRIKLHHPWWVPAKITLSQPGMANQIMDLPYEGNGYNYEATAVMECLREGRTEHPLMPWSATLALQETMDTIRSQWGLRYPME